MHHRMWVTRDGKMDWMKGSDWELNRGGVIFWTYEDKPVQTLDKGSDIESPYFLWVSKDNPHRERGITIHVSTFSTLFGFIPKSNSITLVEWDGDDSETDLYTNGVFHHPVTNVVK